jgi:hypothetical protein
LYYIETAFEAGLRKDSFTLIKYIVALAEKQCVGDLS